MAQNQTVRLSPKTIANDKNTMANLTAITNYAPADKNYEVAKGTPLEADLGPKKDAESKAKGAYKTARDNANASEWAFHNYILGAKVQVAAQFGVDSNEYQSLGLKKKSERKKPTRKKSATTK